MKSGNPLKLIMLVPRMEDRTVLFQAFRDEPQIQVSAICMEPHQARDLVLRTRPEVLVMAMELPRMSGLDFLQLIKANKPKTVICISSRGHEDPYLQARAREAGATMVLDRPTEGLAAQMPAVIQQILRTDRGHFEPRVHSVSNQVKGCDHIRLIAIGASTGGPEALRKIIKDLPTGLPPIVIVQHMPKYFTPLFAQSLDSLGDLEVVEVTERMPCRTNTIYIATGDNHMVVRREGHELLVDHDHHQPHMLHKPSVNVLFHSVAEVMGRHAMGILLTGMGSDGAEGLLAMHQKGALTLTQDEESSVVYGMPREAFLMGAATHIVSLDEVPSYIVQCQRQGMREQDQVYVF